MTKKDLKEKRSSCARRVLNMLTAEDEHSFLEEMKKVQNLIKFHCKNLERHELGKTPWCSAGSLYDLVDTISRFQRKVAEMCNEVKAEYSRYALLNELLGDN